MSVRDEIVLTGRASFGLGLLHLNSGIETALSRTLLRRNMQQAHAFSRIGLYF